MHAGGVGADVVALRLLPNDIRTPCTVSRTFPLTPRPDSGFDYLMSAFDCRICAHMLALTVLYLVVTVLYEVGARGWRGGGCGARRPLPSEMGTPCTVLQTLPLKPRPESGFDCLTFLAVTVSSVY